MQTFGWWFAEKMFFFAQSAIFENYTFRAFATQYLLASGKRGQQDQQCRDPQSHPDQEVFGASHFSCIHGKPLSQFYCWQ